MNLEFRFFIINLHLIFSKMSQICYRTFINAGTTPNKLKLILDSLKNHWHSFREYGTNLIFAQSDMDMNKKF